MRRDFFRTGLRRHWARPRRVGAVLTTIAALVTALVPSTPIAATLPPTLTIAAPEKIELRQQATFSGDLVAGPVGLPQQTISIVVDGAVVTTAITDSTGHFTAPVTFFEYGTHAVKAVAYGGTPGEKSSPTLQIEVVAPEDDTAATEFAGSISFLYTGENPIQEDVAPGTIQPLRAAVVRGLVRNRSGDPLEGVEIRIADHPEFGRTETTDEGTFDLAVNGGQRLVLVYSKEGFASADREVVVPWRDFVVAPDVTLVAYDTAVTEIDADASVSQVARGTAVTDADGTRQATLLFPAGTAATMTLSDGSVQSINDLRVRATEYTVGDTGPEAMPGELPTASGYTYAVEFSVDQAVDAGATKVTFSKPVPTYVENFLGFDAGTSVPAGYYDRDRHAWIAAPNGVVIDIVGETGGLASVDADGDGDADTGTELDAHGITTDEQTRLAELYDTGTSLWRVAVTHFTPWDWNHPYGPPNGARRPNMKKGGPGDASGQCEESGSVIGCENQTLGESLGIAGTPMSLHYDSGRVPGRLAAIQIPLTEATLPPDLLRVEVEMTIAGRRFTHTYDPPAANLSHLFAWDGRDAYGRRVHGSETLTVQIGYVYPAVYRVPAEIFAAFGQTGGPPILGPTRQDATMVQTWSRDIGGLDTAALHGLGGWTLSAHHAYDPDDGVLYFGDGTTRRTDAVFPTIEAFAGNGNAATGTGTHTGDGGAAVAAGLGIVEGLAMAADGALYVADTSNGVVRRIATNGIISTIAGGGSPADGIGDGGSATAAELVSPADVAVGPDGSLYIADAGANRVRRVAPNGTISTIAGGGSSASGLGDNGPATLAALGAPSGIAVGGGGSLYIADRGNDRIRRVGVDGMITTVAGGGSPADGLGDGLTGPEAKLRNPTDVAVAIDGSVFLSDTDHHRVRRIRPDGTIETVAGTGVAGFGGDDGPATAAVLGHPTGLSIDASDGSVIVAQRIAHRVRRLGPDGIITTLAGNGTAGYAGDGGPPARAVLNQPRAAVVGVDGRLYIADTYNFRIRRVLPSLPGFSSTDLLVPAADGGTAFHFDAFGRHLRTIDAVTGLTLLTFDYDADNRLASISDEFDNVTTIERSADGVPTAVIAPMGQRTELTIGTNGYLTRLENPVGDAVVLGYGEQGLLTSLLTSDEQLHEYTYDQLGRLTRDDGPAGSFTELDRTDVADGYQVTAVSAEGRTTTYKVESLANGALRRSTTDASGATATLTLDANASMTAISPDGTRTVTTFGPDPRWGMQAPILVSSVVTTPGGRTRTTLASRSATLTDPANPFSMTSEIDTVTAAGKTHTRSWDAATRTLTLTTPGGRTAVVTLNTDGLVHSRQMPGRLPVVHTYDSRGRLTSATQGTGPAARTVSTTYDGFGFVETVTDPLHTTTYVNDAIGRHLSVTYDDGESIAFDYDDAGRPESVTPPDRSAHTFSYTPQGWHDSQTAPPGSNGAPSEHTWTYDLDGLLESATDPDGRIGTFGYDSAGRVETATSTGGTTTYSYDPTTHVLKQVTGSEGDVSTFSNDGFLSTSVVTTGVVPGTIGYSYDSSLRLSSRTINGGNVVTFARDDDGLATTVGALNTTWHPTKALPTSTTTGTVNTNSSYNDFGEVTSLGASAGTTALYSATITRDPLGRASSKTETVGGVTKLYEYSYDVRGRLTDVTVDGVGSEHYEYDANGNRTTTTRPGLSAVATFDGQDRIGSFDTTTFTHNATGQRTAKTVPGVGTTTYSFEAGGTLRGAVTPTATVDYVLDAAERRIIRKVGGVVTHRYLYGSGMSPIAETNAAGTVTAAYVYGLFPHIPDYMTKSGVTYRFVTDAIGSPRLVVNTATGAVVQRLDYDAFGNVVLDTNPGFQPFGFAGGLYDPDTGLVRMGAREYDPSTGRFLTKDPIGFAGGDANLYGYAENDPVNSVDPTGEAVIVVIAAAAEIAMAVWDAYDTVSTLMDDCASFWDKALAVGGTLAGAVLPGGGYGAADNIARAGRRAKKADKALHYNVRFVPDDCNCFPAGTPVVTDHGEVPIEDLEVGDRVLARDDATGIVSAKPVVGLFSKDATALIDLVVADTEIAVTPEHPFWVDGRGWVPAGELGVGDPLRKADGEIAFVEALTLRRPPSPVRVFNFEVEGHHNYFATLATVLVHNCATQASRLVKHHTIPTAILKELPHKVRNDPDVRGRVGNPNRWAIPEALHKTLHWGPSRGGQYNAAFRVELSELGRKPTSADVLHIREKLTKAFDLASYRPH